MGKDGTVTGPVSVIVPVYNVKPYLKEALDSIIHQTYRNLEIIVVDDGSTDGSEQICDQYAAGDSRIIVIHQENRGLSAARNAGLDRMTGEYVAFLDSDDYFHSDAIQKMLEALERTQADIVICQTEYRQGNHIISGRKQPDNEQMLSSSEALNALMAGTVHNAVWNKIYRKQLWEGLRFLEGQVYEDLMITCCLLEKSNRILVIQETLVCYRIRESSITHTYTEHNAKDRLFSFQWMEDYVTKHPESITPKNIDIFRDRWARKTAVFYAELLHIWGKTETVEKLKTEALAQWQKIKSYHIPIKSKSVRFLLKFFPCFIRPTRAWFRFLKGYRKASDFYQ